MSKELEAFIMGRDQKPIQELEIDEARKECQLWRTLFDWLDIRVRYYLAQIGSQVRVINRFREDIFGDLLGVKFEPIKIEMGVYEKTYDRNAGRYFWERKIMSMEYSHILREEFIEPEGRAPATEDQPDVNFEVTQSEPPILEDNKN